MSLSTLRRGRRSSGADQAPLLTCIHPSARTIDASTIPIEELEEYLANGNKNYEAVIDFVNMPDKTIQKLFVSERTLQKYKGKITPPPPLYRRSASQIRNWFKMGSVQQAACIESSNNVTVEKLPSDNTLFWNGEIWEQVSMHPKHPSHPATIDVNHIPIDELRADLPKGNEDYEGAIDFLGAPDAMIAELFLADNTERTTRSKANEELLPPPPYRRVASQIRNWFKLSTNQRKALVNNTSVNMTVVKSPHQFLKWDGTSWERRGLDCKPTARRHGCGCPGITLNYINSVMRLDEAGKAKKTTGFKHTCRGAWSNRERFSHPDNNRWNYSPPTVGVVTDGNDVDKVRWILEEEAHDNTEDQYDFLSFRAVACDENFDGGDDPAAGSICNECSAAKRGLMDRFDQSISIRENEFKAKTRHTIMERTGSLSKKHRDYHQRQSKAKSQKIRRRDEIIQNMIEVSGIDIEVNQASNYIFNDGSLDKTTEFLSQNLSQDSIALYAFKTSVENHKQAMNSGKKSVRHCPLMIRLGSLVRQKMGHAGGLYELVAKIAGFPSGRTIRRYTVSNSNEPDGIMHDNCNRARAIFNQTFPDAGIFDYERQVTLAFDSMHVKQRFGVGRNTNEIVAIDEQAFDENVILDELRELNGFDGDGDDASDKKFLPDIGKHFLVFIATTWTDKGKIQFLVARHGKTSLTATFLKKQIRECIMTLAFYGFIVDTITGDGASENRAMFKLLCDVSARDILRNTWTEDELKGLPLDFLVGFKHPHPRYAKSVTVVIGGEMPHWVKKFRNALDNKSRSLSFRGMSMELQTLYEIWLASGDADVTTAGAVRKYTFTHDHFKLNAYLKMRAFLAFRIPSLTMIGMIEDHCERYGSDPTNPYLDGQSANIEDYKPMIALFKAVNRLVDIMNGNGFKKGKERDVELINNPKHRHVTELFEILRLFEEWKEEAGGFTTEFITYQTYEDLVWMVFGIACHASMYLKDDGSRTMHQGRSGSDVCEHFFSKMRYINTNPTMQQARECASKVDGNLGMYGRAFMSDSKGNAGTAAIETAPEDLLADVERTDMNKKRDKKRKLNTD